MTRLATLTAALLFFSALVTAQTTRYVAPSGTDASDCSNEASPCATISYAIGESGTGDTIEIADGEYTESTGLDITTSLSLHGESKIGTIIQAHPDSGMATSRVVTIDTTGVGELEVEITDLTIRHGVASGGLPDNTGGGIYDNGAALNLSNVTFTDNSANTGGGMLISGGSPTFTDVTFVGNVAGSGGGLSIGSTGEPILRNVAFLDNVASVSGGGLSIQETDAHLVNALFAGNHAGERGGALFSNGGTPRVATVTMSKNTTEGVGGGIFSDGATFEDWLYIEASIIWGNSANDDGNEFYVDEGGSIELHQVLMKWGPGDAGGEGDIVCTLPHPGCLSSDPLFVDPDNGDFSLSEGSPAIDSAFLVPDSTEHFPVDQNGDPVDLAGNPRLLGNMIDRGTYEWQGSIADDTGPEERTVEGLGLPSPNPASASTSLNLRVDEAQHITVEVFNALGRRVQTLFDGELTAGAAETLTLDASTLPAGVYVVRAQGDDFARTQWVTVVR